MLKRNLEQQITINRQNLDDVNRENKRLNDLVNDFKEQAEDFKKKEANLESTIRYLYFCLSEKNLKY